jgi:hypothetical protein
MQTALWELYSEVHEYVKEKKLQKTVTDQP